MVKILHYNQSKIDLKVHKFLILNFVKGGTVKELKSRLYGALEVDNVQVMLIFCGDIMNDASIVPSEAYELSSNDEDVDAQIFRPRICAKIVANMEEAVVDELVLDQHWQRESNTESDQEMNEEPVAAPRPRTVPTDNSFNLQKELRAIKSEQHYACLASAGFDFEVCYSLFVFSIFVFVDNT